MRSLTTGAAASRSPPSQQASTPSCCRLPQCPLMPPTLPSYATIPLPSSPLNHNRMVPFSAQSQFANWKIAVSAASVSRQPSLTRLNPNEKQDGRQNHPPTHVYHIKRPVKGANIFQSTVSTDDFHTKPISEQQSLDS